MRVTQTFFCAAMQEPPPLLVNYFKLSFVALLGWKNSRYIKNCVFRQHVTRGGKSDSISSNNCGKLISKPVSESISKTIQHQQKALKLPDTTFCVRAAGCVLVWRMNLILIAEKSILKRIILPVYSRCVYSGSCSDGTRWPQWWSSPTT